MDLSTASLNITMGLPLSGKSTWAHTQPNYPTIICPDTFRLALHGQEFVPTAEAHVWASVHLAARALLMEGARVLVDATNARASHREPWMKLARDMELPINIFLFGASAQTCVERARRDSRENMVPIIERMADSWEPVYLTKGKEPYKAVISESEGISLIHVPLREGGRP